MNERVVDYVSISRKCYRCGAVPTPELCRLCDKCFKKGAIIAPPRQTGRTTELLREMKNDPETVLFLPLHHMEQHMRTSYPEFRRHRFATLNQLGVDFLRRSRYFPLLDHTVFELAPHAVNKFWQELEHAWEGRRAD